ncbi:hypothetical protein KY359_06060 [Candidatus Woesearchaeota archaeon]|nr:hypothetical protein [Candidatus Woesearchaeota archaeon]
MPILGLGKKQEPQKAEDVPDELPDLPQTARAAQTQQAPDAGAPDELPPLDQELAPDELPPMTDDMAAEAGAGLAPQSNDRRLYFSAMLQKLHEEGIKSTKLTTPSANLLVDMKKHWKQRKKEEEIESMKQMVADSLNPLQKLEQEWVALQDDIEQKKKLLHEKEEAIRKLAEDAKNLAVKAEKMKQN